MFSLRMVPRVTDRPQRVVLLRSSLPTMILYLLFPALIHGVVESQLANITEEELDKVGRNQTFYMSTNNSTVTPNNRTSSLYKIQTEDELQSNQTSAVITEDDERFQDQENEFPGKHCHQDLLVELSHSYCGETFHEEMLIIGTDNWCVLENVIRPYNDMTICLENTSRLVGCYFPNSNIQDFFIYIHSIYFQNCSEEKLQLEDAPHGLVIALTLIPVSFIPILVYLLVWKSKVHAESQ